MLAAGDCAHAQLVVCAVCSNAGITGFLDRSGANQYTDSGPLGSESSLYFDA